MSHNRTIRSLTHLEHSASTARVLNLNAIARRMEPDVEHRSSPLFCNAMLNRCIVVKHRLRRNEHEVFGDYRLQATKIILPFEPKDLSVGASWFFIGQRGYAGTLDDLIGSQAQTGDHDRLVLQILDASPTLDPFVLRQQLRRSGLEPAPHYLDIGSADLARMFAFVQREIEPLARLSAGGSEPFPARTARLAEMLLSNTVDDETEPLRLTLKLQAGEYREGVFSWKGFLYYKWCLEELSPHIEPAIQDIGRIGLGGAAATHLRAAINLARLQLRTAMSAATDRVRATIDIYDHAYRRLVEHQDPISFRQFLLDAPALFTKLGEGLGALQHVVSYWRYRFPSRALPTIEASEMAAILDDFLRALQVFDPDPSDENSPLTRAYLI